ncbi:MAG TPA: hypothetical protein VLA58_10005 [Chitinophagaceae bacterium]|nr:hypothetical protein [Chitinophagaceae bacterium]
MSFFRQKNEEHFLLDEAKLNLVLVFRDNTKKTIDVKKATKIKGFEIDLKPDLIPDDPLRTGNGVVVKKIISKMQMNFSTGVKIGSTFFTTLSIRQEFSCTAWPINGAQQIEYLLSASGWIDSSGTLKLANMATHPLLDLKDLMKNKVKLNALIVDLTRPWMVLHKDNDFYKYILKHFTSDKVVFKVWGNLSGNAFIWYSVIPRYAEKSDKLSPHVFFSPTDLMEYQNKKKDKDYLLDNADYFKEDGGMLMQYLLPPLDDVRIDSLQPKMTGAAGFIDLREWRNVVNFRFANDGKTITPIMWHIGAGFEKAFYGINSQPQQIFLMPQDYWNPEIGGRKGIQTLGPPDALKQITDTIFDVLLTNTILIGKGKEPIVKKDKFVLSCYSESGFDLWYAVKRYTKNIKGIIAIEPQNLNKLDNGYGLNPPLGKNVLPALQKLKVPIFIIGRHHTRKYKPQNVDLSKIELMPKDAAKVFEYRPDPALNDFMRYRLERILDLDKDPLALVNETDVRDQMAARNPPIVGAELFKNVFGWRSNEDTNKYNHLGFEAWYSHHFALTGGQIMTLPKKGGIYKQIITYSTFFQEAVEKIG